MNSLTQEQFKKYLETVTSEHGIDCSNLEDTSLQQAFNAVNKGLSEIGTAKGKGR